MGEAECKANGVAVPEKTQARQVFFRGRAI